MGAPAQLGRLAALANEAIDRPSVYELSDLFGHVLDLRIPFRNVNGLDTARLR